MIDTKALRTKVLDLAIQGKLTKQLETDGSAKDLLDDSFIEHKNSPFQIPDTWKWVKLSDIGSTNIGLTYHPSDIDDNGTIVIRSSNIVNGKMDYSDIVKVTCSIKENQFLKTNDIVICARNGSKALVGKNAIYYGESNKISFGAFMAIFRTPYFKFVHLFFNTQAFRRNFSSDDSKQINQVTQSILKESLIPLPPLAEQERIIARTEEIFKLLDIIDESQKKYTDDVAILKSKLITMGIQGKLTEQLDSDGTAEELYQQIQDEKQKLIKEGKIKKEKTLPEIKDEEIPFEIPSNWKWVRLAKIVSSLGDGLHGTPEYCENGEYYFINGNNLCNKKIVIKSDTKRVDKNEFLKYKKELTLGTVLVSINGTLGNIAFYNNERIILGKSACYFNLIEPEMKSFIYYILKTDYYLKYAHFSATGVTIKNVSLKAMNELLIPLPPLAEQKRIAEKLDDILKIIDKQKTE